MNNFSKNISPETIAKYWTLSQADITEITQYRKKYRLFIAIQLCSVRLRGRFLLNCHQVPSQITGYLSQQLKLPPTLNVNEPLRKATLVDQRYNIMRYLGFKKMDDNLEKLFHSWIENQVQTGLLPNELVPKAQQYLLDNQIILPGSTVIKRTVIAISNQIHSELYEKIYQTLSHELQQTLSKFLTVNENEQRSYFNQLKDYPPSARIKSLKLYLERYQKLEAIELNPANIHFLDSTFVDYLYKLTKKYNARDMKRFDPHKRHALLICFLIESRKILLDHLVQMHDQYIMDLARKCKNRYEKKHREFRKRHRRAIDVVLLTTDKLLALPKNKSIYFSDLLNQSEERLLRESLEDMNTFKRIEDQGYSDSLLACYPSFRKYFSDFIQLPFQAQKGSQDIIKAIELLRLLDRGEIKKFPKKVPTQFVPKELRKALICNDGTVNRHAWEMGLALALRDKLRSRDVYLPESKQHVSFWDLMMHEAQWKEIKEQACETLNMPTKKEVKNLLTSQYETALKKTVKKWDRDQFASIVNGKLKLKRDDKLIQSSDIINLQKTIEANLPTIRIEKLLKEVDQLTGFTKHFKPIQGHHARPANFYKTLFAGIISQATNLGIVATSASVPGVTVDMLRQVLRNYICEETLDAASGEIVHHHNQHPLSVSQGLGDISSSDAQRFKIRADSLLASYYPRYYGYYEKAIGIYTHVSDQLSVFKTQIISCAPREALYVIDGLLENNTVLKIKAHTTDTHGYTEIIFALCFLLGFYFMPRIRDLKDQQLYRIHKDQKYGKLDVLLTKTADLDIVEEQWESMMRITMSLKKRTTPAHIVVQKLTSSSPNDRLTKAFINLGRIIKTEYILRYLTDADLRRTIQIQLNKGEYRHKIPRWIFFAEQGEFTTGDYEEIMNKASCLSLVSNAILMWNTIKIDEIVKKLEAHGETVTQEMLSHISLLPFKHVLPNGTYFIDDD